MERLVTRSRYKSFARSPLVAALALCLAGALAYASRGVYTTYQESTRRLAEAEKEYARLATHKQQVESAVARLSTEDGFADELRTRFRAVRPGEEVAIVRVGDDVINTLPAVVVAAPVIVENNWWQKVWGWVSDVF
jgi:cell division protein FtsB